MKKKNIRMDAKATERKEMLSKKNRTSANVKSIFPDEISFQSP